MARGSTRKPAEKHSADRGASTTGFPCFGTTLGRRERGPDRVDDPALGVGGGCRTDPQDLQLRGLQHHGHVRSRAAVAGGPAAAGSPTATAPSRPSSRSTRNDEHGDVVGFGSLSPYKERAAYRTSVEDSVYVRRDRVGEGIGKLIVNELLRVAAASGFHAVFARISASSEASIALHRACGFELVGIEREVGRKFNRWLDVALMQALL